MNSKLTKILTCESCDCIEEGVIYYTEFKQKLCRDCRKFLVRQSRVKKPIHRLIEEYGDIEPSEV